jgi:hypothetical protein
MASSRRVELILMSRWTCARLGAEIAQKVWGV